MQEPFKDFANIYSTKGLKIERSKASPTKLYTEIVHKRYIDDKGWNVNVNPSLAINEDSARVIKFSIDKLKKKIERKFSARRKSSLREATSNS